VTQVLTKSVAHALVPSFRWTLQTAARQTRCYYCEKSGNFDEKECDDCKPDSPRHEATLLEDSKNVDASLYYAGFYSNYYGNYYDHMDFFAADQGTQSALHEEDYLKDKRTNHETIPTIHDVAKDNEDEHPYKDE